MTGLSDRNKKISSEIAEILSRDYPAIAKAPLLRLIVIQYKRDLSSDQKSEIISRTLYCLMESEDPQKELEENLIAFIDG